MKRRRLERERHEAERLEEEENRRAAQKEAKEEAQRARRTENWVMAGSVIGSLLIAMILNMCFGEEISYRGQRGWAGGHQDVRLGMALIFGPCVGGMICWMMRKFRK